MSIVHTYSQPFMRARGFLGAFGQDVTDPFSTNYDPFAATVSVPYANAAPYVAPAPVDTSIYDVQYGSPGVAPSASTYEQQAAVQAGNVAPSSSSSSGIIQAITSAFAPGSSVTPKPSPTVSVPLSTSTVGMWASNNMGTIAIVGVVFVVVSSLLGGKRRR